MTTKIEKDSSDWRGKVKSRIWIELDKPASKEHAEKQCALANKMLSKLGDMEGREFFYMENEGYCFGGNMGYSTLPDCGIWFNLDYLAK